MFEQSPFFMLAKKFCTVDAIHKLGSYPVPKGGRSVVTMDRITTQELQGAIVIDTSTTTSRDKCLGFLLDRIFSSFTTIDIPSLDKLTVPRSTVLRHHPKISQRYPNDHSIPLYDNAWNWPLPKDATPPPDRDSKVGWQEIHLSAFFNAIAQAIRPALTVEAHSRKSSVAERYWLGSYSTRRMPSNVDGAGAYHRKPDMILIEKSGIFVFYCRLDAFSSKKQIFLRTPYHG